jgi:hypothetical protein
VRRKSRSAARQLAAEAAKIWIGPKEPAVAVAMPQDEEESVGRRELRTQFWTGLSEYLAAEHPWVPHIDIRPNWTLRLSSGLRHVGFELRFSLRHDAVGIDIWFWRAASRPLWERIRAAPAEYDTLIGESWNFEPVEGRSGRACTSITRPRICVPMRCGRSFTAGSARTSCFCTSRLGRKLREQLDQADTSPATI